nr:extensin family protein [Yoonia ponticola]
MRPERRPYERPDLAYGAATDPQLRAEQDLFAFSPTAPISSERPSLRPAAIEQAAVQRATAIRRGQVCGDPAIQGEVIGNVNGNGRCGIDDAVRVRAVAGVTLRPAATIDCATASALKRWVTTGAMPATGGQVSSLRVVSHYSCRNRNAASTGRLSEHSFGKAIDIAGIGLKSGREITVLTGWNAARDSTALRTMWQAACGPFGTVLGPNANRFHRDHFHFDTASYRSGSYCR